MRSEQKPERRFIELRADDAGISGVALRYGDEARFGDFRERFTPGSVAIQQDVVANIMHDRAKPVARIGAGLTLRESGGAIMARIEWPETVYAREAKELVEARILRGLSIEFRAISERFSDNVRIIDDAELVGLGIVDRPAYPASQIAERIEERFIKHVAPGAICRRRAV